MAGKNILWLCSWYPDKFEPFNGDFVQRHARAAGLYNNIYVLHVVGDEGSKQKFSNEINISAGVTEHLVYYKKISFGGRFRNYSRWLSAYKQAVKSYIDTHGLPDLVHVHVPYRDGVIAIRIKSQYKIPFLVTEHWTIYQPGNEVNFNQQKKIFRSLINWVVRNSLLLLPVSHNLGKQMNSLLTPKEFVVVENVANTDYFFYDNDIKVERFRFVHVSTMGYQKNAEGMIRSFIDFIKSGNDAELILVGPAPAEIRAYVSASGFENINIFFRGEVSYGEVAEEMKAAHSLVLFSRYENSPCSIIEALCCGIPVISTAVGGIPELLNDSNSILISEGDERALEEAFRKMKEDYSVYNKVAISEYAKDKFSYSRIGKKLDDIYTTIVADKK